MWTCSEPLSARLRRFFRAYEADAGDTSVFRARQLQAMLQLTPTAMLVNIANAAVICAVVWAQAPTGFLAAWMAWVTLLSVLGLRGWHRARQRPRRTASSRAMRHAVIHAGLLAGAWAVLPARLFAHLTPGAQSIVGMVITGMLCAGGFALASVPAAATGWVALLGLGSAVAMWRTDSAMAEGLAVMLVLYCAVVIYSVWTTAKTLGARLVAEARADRQHEVIGLLLRDFEDHASDLLWELDATGRFIHVSQRLGSLLGYSGACLRRYTALRLLRRARPSTAEARAQWDGLLQQLAHGNAFREQVIALSGPAGPSWWSLSARPLLDGSGQVVGWRGVAADVTDKQLAHRRLSWLAHNDSLTGLVNRNRFRELLNAALQAADGAMPPVAVVTMDLLGFKQVNDTRGHAVGDRLLCTLGQRLLAAVRPGDTVARLGGDEFAVLVREECDREALGALAQRLLAAVERPAEVEGGAPVALRASAGIAMAPWDGADADTLMSHADIALYAAKRAGGSRWRCFESEMSDKGRRRAALEEALRGAAGRGELRLEYQPQVGAADGRVSGFEALLRWTSSVHGAVSPVEFVPIAEAAGLMPQIGEWVLFEACRQVRQWPQEVGVSINVSAMQLGDPGFVAQVETAARGLCPKRIELEITESALIDDVDAAVRTLNRLRERGFRIALDDFGTGYSALGYLRRFRFDTLKIDRSFVRDLAVDGEARAIVDTILAMARALHMTAIAEGVETTVQAQMLRERGCAALQGFLISRPLPPAAADAFLAAQDPSATPALTLVALG